MTQRGQSHFSYPVVTLQGLSTSSPFFDWKSTKTQKSTI